ncbi:tetratricopeptide repeat protein [Bacteriovoracales bacterium]|nr:tetratricopeptide repeat protein [Bacteriovoracales bacterium]
MTIDDFRYEGGVIPFKGWLFFEVLGQDKDSFLQSQLTNDLTNCQLNFAQLNARLDRNGKVQTFLYVGKKENKTLLLVPESLADFTIRELEKFIIMEDVKIEPLETTNVFFYLTPIRNQYNLENDKLLGIEYLGEEGLLYWGEENRLFFTNINHLAEDEVSGLRVLNGWPTWGQDLDSNKLINETTLNESAISYSKGCFLGQETASKIHNNRGSTYYPILLELKNSFDKKELNSLINHDFKVKGRKGGTFYSFYEKMNKIFVKVALYREFRVKGSFLEIMFDNGICLSGVIHYFPYFKDKTSKEKADQLFFKGTRLFQEGKEEDSIKALELCLKISPEHSDAYESIGVIHGRLGQFEKAIEYMDKLLEVHPESVMAHTNKSLYLMKLGRIEEAEEEKSNAAVKSFSYFGEEAKKKKDNERREQDIQEELKRKEGMFLSVLEIDEDDVLANFGLGEINYKKNNFKKANEHLEKVILLDLKHSVAYLTLGKSYEASGDIEKAREIYNLGIEVASKKGEMKPANEMQSRLSNLTKSKV